jgi:hypothetical protein
MTQLEFPLARDTDPITSHEAAASVRDNSELIRYIRSYVRVHGPVDAFTIADAVQNRYGQRWQEDTIRSACARAGLEKHDTVYALTPGGRRCCCYVLRTIETTPL